MTRDPSSVDHPEPGVGREDADAETEGFLDRWSRRKHGARQAVQASPPAAPAVTEHAPVTPAADPEPPDLESLDADSDYSGIFSPKVSEELRRRALRKLFGAGKFNFRDGLDDYDDDYRSFEALGDIVTSDMRREWERTGQSPSQSTAGQAGPDSPDEPRPVQADGDVAAAAPLQSEPEARTDAEGAEPADSEDDAERPA